MLRLIHLLFFESFEFLEEDDYIVGRSFKYRNPLFQIIGQLIRLDKTVTENIGEQI